MRNAEYYLCIKSVAQCRNIRLQHKPFIYQTDRELHLTVSDNGKDLMYKGDGNVCLGDMKEGRRSHGEFVVERLEKAQRVAP